MRSEQPEGAVGDAGYDYYRDENALFSMVVAEDTQKETLDTVRQIIGKEGAMSDGPVDTVASQASTQSEIGRMMLIIIPTALVILLFTTTFFLLNYRDTSKEY